MCVLKYIYIYCNYVLSLRSKHVWGFFWFFYLNKIMNTLKWYLKHLLLIVVGRNLLFCITFYQINIQSF